MSEHDRLERLITQLDKTHAEFLAAAAKEPNMHMKAMLMHWAQWIAACARVGRGEEV